MINQAKIDTEEQLRKDIIDDLDHNYFIEAGAGAGKTALVVDRVANQIKNGIKPEEIVVITFTNKAAQELRDRIAKKAGCNIGNMQISTIHSFCNRILKENCFDAKMRMDYELLEDQDEEDMQNEFFVEWFKNNADGFCKLNQYLERVKKSFGYDDLFVNFRNICDLPDGYRFYRENLDEIYSGRDGIKKEIAKLKEENDDIIKTIEEKYPAELEKQLKTAVGTCLEGMLYDDFINSENVYANFTKGTESIIGELAKDKAPIRNGKGIERDVSARINQTILNMFQADAIKYQNNKKKIQENKERVKELEKPCEATYIASAVLEFILPAREEYRKQAFNRKLTNDILLQKTNELLNNPAVVSKLRNMYKCIYVDESQDTDPVQNELILKLWRDDAYQILNIISGGNAADKESKNSKTDIDGQLQLVVVGDVNQSIYRFREADYRLFNKTKELFNHVSGCKVEALEINNRSTEELIEFFNEKAGSIEEMEFYNKMTPRHASRTGDVVHGVYKVPAADPTKDDEANVIRVIKNLVGKEKIVSRENGQDVCRLIKYSDFLILTCKKTADSCGTYVNALQDAGIPVNISVQFTPGEMSALRRFARLYNYLANPLYHRGIEGALLVAQRDTSNPEKLNKEKLEEWKAVTKDYDGAQLAGWLLEQGECYLYSMDDASPNIDGHLIKQCQMIIRQMLNNIISKVGNNAADIATEISEYIKTDFHIERDLRFDQEEDAVRLMNIHKAKGLEGNIVIIAQRLVDKDVDSNFTDGNDRYQVITKGKGKYASYSLNDAIRERAQEESAKEYARLEYVAVTRAREALIFMDQKGKKDGDKDTHYFFDKYVDDSIPELTLEELDEAAAINASVAANTSLSHTTSPSDEAKETRNYRISPSTMEVHGVKPIVPALPQGDENTIPDELLIDNSEDDELVNDVAELLDKRPSGDIFGIVMHRAFELAVVAIRSRSAANDYELYINRAISESNADIETRYKNGADNKRKEFKEYLLAIVPEFADFIRNKICEAEDVLTEYPFSLTVSGDELREVKAGMNLTSKNASALPADGEEDSRTVWINGKADLVLRYPDKTVIWDYKSDKDTVTNYKDGTTSKIDPIAFAQTIHDKYDNQMTLYKYVFKKLFGLPAEGNFYSIEIGQIN